MARDSTVTWTLNSWGRGCGNYILGPDVCVERVEGLGGGIRWEESKAVIIETDVFRMKTQDMCGTKKQFSITDMLNYYQV